MKTNGKIFVERFVTRSVKVRRGGKVKSADGFETVARWEGGLVAGVTAEVVDAAGTQHIQRPERDILLFGSVSPLRVRIVGKDPHANHERYLVMRDGRLAVAVAKYRVCADWVLNKFMRAEVYFRSYGIVSLVEGKQMPATTRLARRLL